MMQPCASAARLRGGRPILHRGSAAMLALGSPPPRTVIGRPPRWRGGAPNPLAREAVRSSPSRRPQGETLRHLARGRQLPQRDHVLDDVAQTAPDLVLILSREGLRPARRGAETTPAEPSSPPRSRRSAGQGGDDGPAACDEPAAQPGGGLRAAARWSGRSRGRVRASPAAPLASGPGAPEDAAEGGGV